MSADTSEVRGLAEHLIRIADAAPADVRQVVAKGCLNIKTDARRRVEGLAHAPHYPRSITYETAQTPTGATGEVGPDKERRQGALGNLIEHGSINNPPKPHMGPAGEAEAPRFARALVDLGAELIEQDRR
ncbi:hypothetical protein [Actinoplanes rectilineatus]|uniref:hypothetical protein n=1 Tax=Actinoplanes rectilineatus TaxID=113571 RepID=UPI0005F2F37B|nr:hypothetical protein [Actinoplanes rectilineatus]